MSTILTSCERSKVVYPRYVLTRDAVEIYPFNPKDPSPWTVETRCGVEIYIDPRPLAVEKRLFESSRIRVFSTRPLVLIYVSPALSTSRWSPAFEYPSVVDTRDAVEMYKGPSPSTVEGRCGEEMYIDPSPLTVENRSLDHKSPVVVETSPVVLIYPAVSTNLWRPSTSYAVVVDTRDAVEIYKGPSPSTVETRCGVEMYMDPSPLTVENRSFELSSPVVVETNPVVLIYPAVSTSVWRPSTLYDVVVDTRDVLEIYKGPIPWTVETISALEM